MRIITVTVATFAVAALASAGTQSEQRTERSPEPLYRVTIVSRTAKAINYGYLSAPTRIDFAPTPLLTGARGEATVEPKRGATAISARFTHVPPPTRFGRQYLTYVVWAISPDGRAQNLGELTLDGSGKGKLDTSTGMQTFAMIVTAEPYYSVRQPSDVVVLENQIGSGTVGKVEAVNASYELLPRKEFTYDADAASSAQSGQMLPRDQYDAVVALYQAQNAIQIAEAQHAEKYAPERIAKARALYEQARGYPSNLSSETISIAREATQIAEDSRAIAAKRAADERNAEEKLRVSEARQRAEQNRAAAIRAQQELEADRAASMRPAPAPPPAAAAQDVAPPPPPPPGPAAQTNATQNSESTSPIEVNPHQFHRTDPQAKANRQRIMSALSGVFDVHDTPRGIVVTLSDPEVTSASLADRLRPLALAVQPYRDLHLEVEGHSDAPQPGATEREADSVRSALILDGAPGAKILARGLGNSRPRASNATAEGRAENRRVEIVVSGDAIGLLPLWDRTYTLQPESR